MADTEYLSIAEFAEAINVSKQAVYKRIKKKLSAEAMPTVSTESAN
jgi:predicted DNA-binding protein YlxM (UPF0122 family)